MLKKSYLYIVIDWGKEPMVFRTKTSLVNYLDKKNSRLVDDWFLDSWYSFVSNKVVLKVEIPKVKSKIR